MSCEGSTTLARGIVRMKRTCFQKDDSFMDVKFLILGHRGEMSPRRQWKNKHHLLAACRSLCSVGGPQRMRSLKNLPGVHLLLRRNAGRSWRSRSR